MKHIFISLFFLGSLYSGIAQELNLRNALVISHLDKQQDRFSLEIACSEVLANAKIKNAVSLNVLKQGGNPLILLSDSLSKQLNNQGIDTYMLVSVRGYDKRFQKSTQTTTLAEDLAADNLFPIYKEEIVSVTFEFHFYRGGQLVYTDLLKINGASSRDKVLKNFRKKLAKRLDRKWR
jgi:hypothetical protein